MRFLATFRQGPPQVLQAGNIVEALKQADNGCGSSGTINRLGIATLCKVENCMQAPEQFCNDMCEAHYQEWIDK